MNYFWAYLQERFPLQSNGVLIVSYFTANYLLAYRAGVQNDEPILLSWKFLAGCLVLLCMFFHMRVIDEHKDFERDVFAHPNRVLSRGLITLKHLRNAGIAAVMIEVSLSSLIGLPAFFMYVCLLLFSWFIYKEFYFNGWLEKHLIASAFIHLLIMPAYSLFVFSVVSNDFFWNAPLSVLLYAWVSYGVGFAYELARKTRAPADERAGVITYSNVMGAYPPAWGALLALLFSGALSVYVGVLMNFTGWYHAIVFALLLIVTLGVLHFRFYTNTQTAKNLQIYAGLFIFAFDILLVVEIIRLQGLAVA